MIVILMNLMQPEPGLIFWQSIVLIVVLVVLKKFAWKPILAGIQKRENEINQALDLAKQAKAELADIQANKTQILGQAYFERDQVLHDAASNAKQLIAQAHLESEALKKESLQKALLAIDQQKQLALESLKKHLALLALQNSELVLKSFFQDPAQQQQFIQALLHHMQTQVKENPYIK